MEPPPTGMRRRPRLNPFAFPSDTGLRFYILLAFVMAAGVGRWLATGFALRPWPITPGSGGGPQDPDGVEAWFNAVHGVAAFQLELMLLGLVLLVLSTYAIYRCYPFLTVRRLRLTRFTPAQVPELGNALDRLCTVAGLHTQPDLWWNPLDRRSVALAFGAGPRYRVGFTGGVALLAYTDPPAFQAILLHELAHIRNGDIRRTYLSLAAWWAFLVAAIVPNVIASLTSTTDFASLAAVMMIDLAVFGIVGCVAFILRNSVLRARELYADVRSFAWLRDEAALSLALDRLRPAVGLRRFASPHPDPTRRRRLAQDTEEMFRFGLWDAFGIGVIASYSSLMFVEAVSFVTYLFPIEFLRAAASENFLQGAAAFVLPALIPTAVVLPMAIGAVTMVIWRDTFRTVVGYGGQVRAMRIAGALSVGLLLGGLIPAAASVLSFGWLGYGQTGMPNIPVPTLVTTTLEVSLLLTAMLTAAVLVFLKWVAAGAAAWLSVAITRQRPAAPFWSGVILSYLLAAVWLSVLPLTFAANFMTGLVLDTHARPSPSDVFWMFVMGSLVFPTNILTWLTVVTCWAFPLSAGLFRARGSSDTAASWTVLDPQFGTIAFRRRPLFLRRSLLIGVVAGTVAALALFWLIGPLGYRPLHDLVLPPTSDAMLSAVTEFGATALACVLVQGMAAAAAVLAIPTLSIVHAMFTAFVAGWILGAAEILLALWDRTSASIGTLMHMVAAPTVIGGALAAAACATGSWAVKRLGHAFAARLLMRWSRAPAG
jgi:Zn-dependent protease with chaperone function